VTVLVARAAQPIMAAGRFDSSAFATVRRVNPWRTIFSDPHSFNGEHQRGSARAGVRN